MTFLAEEEDNGQTFGGRAFLELQEFFLLLFPLH